MLPLSHLAAHLYGVPLMIHRPKLDVILAVLGDRIGNCNGMNPAAGSLPIPLPRSPPPIGIAVIPIYGTLVKRTLGLDALSGLTSYQSIADQLDSALADPSISAILLDIDSAGGEANGVFDLADKIVAARQLKPICAVANDSAFSAAYALASAASKVFVTRTGGLGSIGVIAMHVDQSAKDAQEGLSYTPIYAGSHKNDLNPHEPLTDAGKAGLQTEVDRLYQLFVETVMRNRNLSAEAIKATEGGLFFGQDAVSAGLADQVGHFEQALAECFDFTQGINPTITQDDFTQRPLLWGFSMKEASMPEKTEVQEGMFPAPIQQPLTDAIEIADLCTLAGCPEQIAAYLTAQLPVAKVRQDLLQKRAQNSAQTNYVNSYLAPAEVSTDDVMLKAVQKKMASQQITKSGVRP